MADRDSPGFFVPSDSWVLEDSLNDGDRWEKSRSPSWNPVATLVLVGDLGLAFEGVYRFSFKNKGYLWNVRTYKAIYRGPITPLITGRGPPCMGPWNFHFANWKMFVVSNRLRSLFMGFVFWLICVADGTPKNDLLKKSHPKLISLKNLNQVPSSTNKIGSPQHPLFSAPKQKRKKKNSPHTRFRLLRRSIGLHIYICNCRGWPLHPEGSRGRTSLPETNSKFAPEKRLFAPKGNDRIPTIHF